MVKVLYSGFYSTIQDLGRFSASEYGVPYSGVMDVNAMRLANMILGNALNNAVMELTMLGPQLQFLKPTYIAITGASMQVKLNGNLIKMNKVISVHKNDKLQCSKITKGFRSYIAVKGGFKTETVLGSRSMYKGVTKYTHLINNMTLEIDEVPLLSPFRYASVKVNFKNLNSTNLQVFKGAEFHFLNTEQQQQILNTLFTVSKLNNRMAYQLEQPILNHLEPIITSPVLPGTVQLTPSGKLIVLMRDCQTTGGYPRVLQLAKNSINILAQKVTGARVKFVLEDI